MLKLVKYLGEAENLAHALKASACKINVFLFAIVALVAIFGSTVYVIEGAEKIQCSRRVRMTTR